ncbi:restriction endonuclease [Streptomyces sp. NPDC091217]|uniref:restriction endonuclease n=1 Tax=Streptomyces sp. NPDC091217 TaxID=3365975 RepID=UPI00381DC944
MIIDRTAGVTPNRFLDRGLRQDVGRLIGKATRDDMLRTFLWASECQIAHEICEAWTEHISVLDRELREAVQRQADTQGRTYSWGYDSRNQVTKDCHQTTVILVSGLRKERNEAGQAHHECSQVLFELTSHFGTSLTKRVPIADASGAPLLDTLAPLRKQLDAARSRLAALIADDREALHELALREGYRRVSLADDSSVSLADIDSMTPVAFGDLVEVMLQRDGFRTARPVGVGRTSVVAATCPRGHLLLVSTHRVQAPFGQAPEPAARVGAPALHTVRVVAERLEPDLVVVVTNGHFSEPARRYGDANDMWLLPRRDLQSWAEWQEPVECCDDSAQDVA